MAWTRPGQFSCVVLVCLGGDSGLLVTHAIGMRECFQSLIIIIISISMLPISVVTVIRMIRTSTPWPALERYTASVSHWAPWRPSWALAHKCNSEHTVCLNHQHGAEQQPAFWQRQLQVARLADLYLIKFNFTLLQSHCGIASYYWLTSCRRRHCCTHCWPATPSLLSGALATRHCGPSCWLPCRIANLKTSTGRMPHRNHQPQPHSRRLQLSACIQCTAFTS
jgi:hypothetical protein